MSTQGNATAATLASVIELLEGGAPSLTRESLIMRIGVAVERLRSLPDERQRAIDILRSLRPDEHVQHGSGYGTVNAFSAGFRHGVGKALAIIRDGAESYGNTTPHYTPLLEELRSAAPDDDVEW